MSLKLGKNLLFYIFYCPVHSVHHSVINYICYLCNNWVGTSFPVDRKIHKGKVCAMLDSPVPTTVPGTGRFSLLNEEINGYLAKEVNTSKNFSDLNIILLIYSSSRFDENSRLILFVFKKYPSIILLCFIS